VELEKFSFGFPQQGYTPWPKAGASCKMSSFRDGEFFAVQNETHTMHILFPVLANVIWIGGGGLGLILIIVVVVLLLR
jgi:hypothetical protein